VGAALKLVPLARENLRERHFGDLIGTSSSAIDWACAPANGETLSGFVERKRAALDAALVEPGPVLVVAHGGSLYVLAALLGVAIGPEVLGNAQPLRFERNGPTWTVRALARNVDGGAAIA
jgi:glucosyl-3-phosphoglycerate phosphatase